MVEVRTISAFLNLCALVLFLLGVIFIVIAMSDIIALIDKLIESGGEDLVIDFARGIPYFLGLGMVFFGLAGIMITFDKIIELIRPRK